MRETLSEAAAVVGDAMADIARAHAADGALYLAIIRHLPAVAVRRIGTVWGGAVLPLLTDSAEWETIWNARGFAGDWSAPAPQQSVKRAPGRPRKEETTP